MKLTELFEQQQWAVDNNVNHSIGWASIQLKQHKLNLVWVNIVDLFTYLDSEFTLDLDDLTGGRNSIGNRLANAKQFWADGGYMNPSDISINKNGIVNWGDGRHRMAAAYQLGDTYGPVLMDDESLENLKNSSIKTR